MPAIQMSSGFGSILALSRAIPFLVSTLLSRSPAELPAQAAASSHPNFVFFRYASRTSLSLYGGYGQGNWVGFFGMVQNPRTGYREIAGGLGGSVRMRPWLGGFIAVAASDASDGWYGQIFLQANLRLGQATTYVTGVYYQPLESSGTHQLKINPALLMWRAFGRVELGGAYLFLGTIRARDIHQIGPALQIGVPHGRALLEVLRRLSDTQLDVRMTFQAFY